jgi:hypothetical protein
MALVANIYRSTPKDGGKRVLVHGTNGVVHSVNGLYPNAFTAVVRQRDGFAVDRSNELQRTGSRANKTRVLGRDGYFQSANSRDSLISERPEPTVKIRKPKQRVNASVALASALGVRRIVAVVETAVSVVVDEVPKNRATRPVATGPVVATAPFVPMPRFCMWPSRVPVY